MPHIKHALIRYRTIDKLLRNKYRPYPSKEQLRRACEQVLFGTIENEHISDSTLEKDLFAMRMELDAPIKYSKREGGYYYTDPDFSINDVPLTEDDIASIRFAAKTLSQFRDVDLFKQFGSAIDKIVDRVEVSQDRTAEQFIQFEKALADQGNEYLAPLLKAAKEIYWVSFDYASFVTGELKPRKVLPLLLKQYRNRWYLISFDHAKQDYITYALDRIEELQVSHQKGSRPKNFNPDNYFKHSIGITAGNAAPSTVRLAVGYVAAKYLDSLPMHSSQKVVEMDDHEFTFTLNVNVSEELIREILSYGGEIRVLAPLELKEEVQRRAKQLLERNSFST